MKKLVAFATPILGVASYAIYTALTAVGTPEAWHFH
jgi:hypothetical protein